MIGPIELSGFAELQALWARGPEIVRREMTGAMWQAELLLEKAVKEKTPESKSPGNLRGSIAAQTPEISAANVLGVVGTPQPYAIPVELGSKPHFPPIQPLQDWVVDKFGLDEKEARRVAWAIAITKARSSTLGVFMFKKGYDENVSRVNAIWDVALTRIRNRLAATGAPS